MKQIAHRSQYFPSDAIAAAAMRRTARGGAAKMRGQYFSFDAIVATVILVMAITTLASYWFGVQSVVDAKSNYLFSTARQASDELMSGGLPQGWTEPGVIDLSDPATIANIRQLGLGNGDTGDINATKVELLQRMALDRNFYSGIKNLTHTGGYGEEIYIWVYETDGAANAKSYAIGCPYPDSGSQSSPGEVAMAHRGGRLVFDPRPDGTQDPPVPAGMLVAVWTQNAKNPIRCPPASLPT